MSHKQDKKINDEDLKKEESYLNLKLLGTVTTYCIIVMIALGLVFLGGIIIWILRVILGV